MSADNRLFTNRDEHLRAFANAIRAKEASRRGVLAFRGMGGVGKSALSVELGRVLDGTSNRAPEIGLSGLATETGDLPWARISFENPDLRTAPRALYRMQQKLYADHGIRFPKFSLAYGIYWSTANPNVELKRTSLPFLEEGEFLASAIEIAEDVPGLSLAAKVPKLLEKLRRRYTDWNLKVDDEALQNLAGKSARDIEAELPAFWADDLARERGTQGLQAVLFLDTHEALHTGDRSTMHYHSSDWWVRNWIDAVPGALWVVTGRDRLEWHEDDAKWEEIVTERLVDNLAPKYVCQMLAAAGIDDEAVVQAIIEHRSGNPYEVNLSIDLAQRAQERGVAVRPDMFEGTPEKLHRRLFRNLGESEGRGTDDRYLEDKEIRALELLSAPRTWDRSLYKLLVREFGVGKVIADFPLLLKFSFVQDLEDGTYSLHQRTREAMHEHAMLYDLDEVHRFMFEHYRGQFEDIEIKELRPEHGTALREAFYHASNILKARDLANWFLGVDESVRYTLPFGTHMSELQSLMKIQKNEREHDLLVSKTLHLIAELCLEYRKLELGLNYCTEALSLIDSCNSDNDSTVFSPEAEATVLNTIALLYEERGDLRKALQYYQLALIVPQRYDVMTSIFHAKVLNNLGDLHRRLGNYESAWRMLSTAMRKVEKDPGLNRLKLVILNSMALVSIDMGDFEQGKQSLEIILEYELNHMSKDHPSLATTLYNLAVSKSGMGNYEGALEDYERSLRIRAKTYGYNSPQVGLSLNGLGMLYLKMDRCKKSEEVLNNAFKIFSSTLGTGHPDTRMVRKNLELCRQTCEER